MRMVNDLHPSQHPSAPQVCRVTADRIDFLPVGSLALRPALNIDRNAGSLALCMIW